MAFHEILRAVCVLIVAGIVLIRPVKEEIQGLEAFHGTLIQRNAQGITALATHVQRMENNGGECAPFASPPNEILVKRHEI